MSLKRLSKKQLNEITEFASVMFHPEEIEEVLELEGLADELRTEGTAAFKALRKGQLQAKYKVRKNTFLMAENGSSPAQTAAEKMIKNYELKEISEKKDA